MRTHKTTYRSLVLLLKLAREWNMKAARRLGGKNYREG